ncbi:NYN domain-containing protein [Candidatus Pacearchaeota archaeon]|nr:NYN domain-containing protein [Candidatus Pacearchaeota archaeon]
MERVSVFIDGENFLYGMKSINKFYSDFHFDFKKYIINLTKGRKLIDVYYFIAPLKQEITPELYKKQQKLLTRLRQKGIKTILCKRTKRDNSDGTQSHKIKEDDIRLALQMQKDAYENKFDIAILVSGDGDFVPLPEYLSEKSKKMEVAYFEGQTAFTLLRVCNFRVFLINKKILNKFFYRE